MSNTHILTSVLLSAVIGCGLAAPASAKADAQLESHSRKVWVGDLNLSSETGAREAIRRINRAADRVCRDASIVQHQTRYRQCVRHAVKQAVSDTHSAVVTSLHENRSTMELAAK
jgi:UrcA family protein